LAPVQAAEPTPSDPLTEQAAALLDRMGTAVHSLNYEGTLVYLVDDRLETLHLVHRVDEGRVQERLVSLSGPVRAVTREHDRVTCVMPDGHPISVKSHAGRNLLRSARIDPRALSDRYRVEIPGAARVAGRDTDVLVIRPLDALRYGYQFYLDRETGLPLKSDLIDHQGGPVEQLLFTGIAFHGTSDAPPQAPTRTADDALSPPPPGPWRFDAPPRGFALSMHDSLDGPTGTSLEQFVFSDQLSSYSIYIERDTRDGLEGVTRVGAVHAAGRRLGDYQVTAVGEVPQETVEAAVAGVSRLPEPHP
jgi:sigma-E factor negative regulatory protein RseB